MTAFRSRWDDWAPKEPPPQGAKSAKSPSGTFGSSSTRPFTGEIDHSALKRGAFPSMMGSQKAPLSRTDKSAKSLSQALKLTPDGSLLRRAHLAVVPDLSDPEDTRVWLIKRAAMRELGSGTTRVDADKLVFDELLWIWHAANPVTHAPGQCAARWASCGCGARTAVNFSKCFIRALGGGAIPRQCT